MTSSIILTIALAKSSPALPAVTSVQIEQQMTCHIVQIQLSLAEKGTYFCLRGRVMEFSRSKHNTHFPLFLSASHFARINCFSIKCSLWRISSASLSGILLSFLT